MPPTKQLQTIGVSPRSRRAVPPIGRWFLFSICFLANTLPAAVPEPQTANSKPQTVAQPGPGAIFDTYNSLYLAANQSLTNWQPAGFPHTPAPRTTNHKLQTTNRRRASPGAIFDTYT